MNCKYREWGWHDGGPDYRCNKHRHKCLSCVDSYADYYDGEDCEIRKEEGEEDEASVFETDG